MHMALSSCSAWGLLLRDVGFSLRWVLWLQGTGFRCLGLGAPRHVGSSWIEPLSLALQGGFLNH